MAAESSSSAPRSGVSPESYVGSLISLTSKSEIRYEGILYNINTEESSIGLRNVRSFGTEGRKKDGPQVLPSDKVYEYILFRGSDIKDLQVKTSTPVQSVPQINNDPAIIQSHYPRPPITTSSLSPVVSAPALDLNSQSTQTGNPSSTQPQTALPLYQPGGNFSPWGSSLPQPNTSGNGLGMPMYWPGFYSTPNGLPQLNQQSLLRPPPGLPMNPSIPQMQYSTFNSSIPTSGLGLPSSNMPEYPSSSLTSSLSSTIQPLPPTLASSVLPLTASVLSTTLPGATSVGSLGLVSSAPSDFPALSQPKPSVGTLNTSAPLETTTSTPSLVTPGHLLQTGPTSVLPNQSAQSVQKDVEVVQASPPKQPTPVKSEAQPPILPLPQQTYVQRPNGGAMRHNYRGRGGRGGTGISRAVTTFTEEFDFMAMNEKFNKDEVWGHLGKSAELETANENGEDSNCHKQDGSCLSKAVYNKDDFFDSLSSNALDRESNQSRTRFSEQRKIDVETFGDFSRYRGGRGGRGSYRGGRSRGGYYNGGGGGYTGRGYGGGGYGGGRGRG